MPIPIAMILVALVAIVGVFLTVAAVSTFKLMIIAMIAIPMSKVFYEYVCDYMLKLDKNISVVVASALTLIFCYVAYTNWLSIIISSIFALVIYEYLLKQSMEKYTKWGKTIEKLARGVSGK